MNSHPFCEWLAALVMVSVNNCCGEVVTTFVHGCVNVSHCVCVGVCVGVGV